MLVELSVDPSVTDLSLCLLVFRHTQVKCRFDLLQRIQEIGFLDMSLLEIVVEGLKAIEEGSKGPQPGHPTHRKHLILQTTVLWAGSHISIHEAFVLS